MDANQISDGALTENSKEDGKQRKGEKRWRESERDRKRESDREIAERNKANKQCSVCGMKQTYGVFISLTSVTWPFWAKCSWIRFSLTCFGKFLTTIRDAIFPWCRSVYRISISPSWLSPLKQRGRCAFQPLLLYFSYISLIDVPLADQYQYCAHGFGYYPTNHFTIQLIIYHMIERIHIPINK